MFLFGHLGVGSRILTPFTKKLDLRWVLLGCILPDLLDKPLYYGTSLLSGQHGVANGLICGTRTFGHTVLFLTFFVGPMVLRRSKGFSALALGIASHLLLDSIVDTWMTHRVNIPFLWPLPDWPFPVFPHKGAGSHLMNFFHPVIFWSEVVGALFCFELYLRNRKKRRIF